MPKQNETQSCNPNWFIWCYVFLSWKAQTKAIIFPNLPHQNKPCRHEWLGRHQARQTSTRGAESLGERGIWVARDELSFPILNDEILGQSQNHSKNHKVISMKHEEFWELEATTPMKTNMEHNHRGWKIMFLSNWVSCGFHVYLPGCSWLKPIWKICRSQIRSLSQVVVNIKYIWHQHLVMVNQSTPLTTPPPPQ